MVVQRSIKAPIYGTAGAGEKVTISFRGQDHVATADDGGKWKVELAPQEAGGPFPMTIKGSSTVELKDVYVGDVWVCSGQSNMVFSVGQSTGGKEAASQVSTPNEQVRLLSSPGGKWAAASSKSIMGFTAVGYWMGAELNAELKVPIGLIQGAVGGTPIEQWGAADKLAEVGVKSGGGLYNKHIKPIIPFAIKGAIWYQGESNAGNANYGKMLQALIESWRRDWAQGGQGDFPFIYIQLPRIGAKNDQVGGWVVIRETQRKTLSVPNTAMVVAFDVTDGNLHPNNKKPMGHRLALAARAIAYGEKIEYSGPLFESAKRDGDKVIVSFTHAEGLAAKGGDLRQFEAAREDGKFKDVAAKIEGSTVVLDVTGIAGELKIRYAAREWPDGNLFNGAELPASPFVVSGVK